MAGPQSVLRPDASRDQVRAKCQAITKIVQTLVADLPRITSKQAHEEIANLAPEKLAALEAQCPGFTELYQAALISAVYGKQITDAALEQTIEIFVDLHSPPPGVAN